MKYVQYNTVQQKTLAVKTLAVKTLVVKNFGKLQQFVKFFTNFSYFYNILYANGL